MKNLLEETISKLNSEQKTLDDIEFISLDDEYIPLEVFKNIANKSYYSGYGESEINKSLMIVGKDWWLERYDYDGCEWWEFKQLPVKPTTEHKNPRYMFEG